MAGAKGSDSGARTASAEVVRVATYNIHRARGLDGQVSLNRIADVLRQIDADVVGVQEVYEAQAEHLARDLEMQFVTGVTVHRSDGAYGNAIFTRLPLQGVATFDLSVRTREARGGIRVDLALREQILHVFNVHLGLRGRERAEQVKWLVERHILWDDRTGPRVVIGDLNEWFPPGRVGRALRREFTSLRRRLTHPALLPLWALDRIYWDHAVRGESLRVHRSRLARVASDHLPLVASLRLDRLVVRTAPARDTMSSRGHRVVPPKPPCSIGIGSVVSNDAHGQLHAGMSAGTSLAR